MKFQIGDKVRVIDHDVVNVPMGTIATVTHISDKTSAGTKGAHTFVGINKGIRQHRSKASWFDYHFELISKTPNMKQPRLANGRFTYADLKLPQVVNSNSPSNFQLKRGSIYRVLGGSVGRYSGGATTIKGVPYVIISTHGTPAVVKQSLVRKADKEDVEAYLAVKSV